MIKRIARWILRYELRQLNTQTEMSVPVGTIFNIGEEIFILSTEEMMKLEKRPVNLDDDIGTSFWREKKIKNRFIRVTSQCSTVAGINSKEFLSTGRGSQ